VGVEMLRPSRAPPPQGGREQTDPAARAVAHIETMNDLIAIFAQRGDLAHLALFLWAASTTALLYAVLRALSAAMARFDDFVREISRFNDRYGDR